MRLANPTRDDLDAVGALPLMLAEDRAGGPRRSVPLREVASFQFSEVSRENGQRRVVVQSNVAGRDLGSFVGEARARVADTVLNGLVVMSSIRTRIEASRCGGA